MYPENQLANWTLFLIFIFATLDFDSIVRPSVFSPRAFFSSDLIRKDDSLFQNLLSTSLWTSSTHRFPRGAPISTPPYPQFYAAREDPSSIPTLRQSPRFEQNSSPSPQKESTFFDAESSTSLKTGAPRKIVAGNGVDAHDDEKLLSFVRSLRPRRQFRSKDAVVMLLLGDIDLNHNNNHNAGNDDGAEAFDERLAHDLNLVPWNSVGKEGSLADFLSLDENLIWNDFPRENCDSNDRSFNDLIDFLESDDGTLKDKDPFLFDFAPESLDLSSSLDLCPTGKNCSEVPRSNPEVVFPEFSELNGTLGITRTPENIQIASSPSYSNQHGALRNIGTKKCDSLNKLESPEDEENVEDMEEFLNYLMSNQNDKKPEKIVFFDESRLPLSAEDESTNLLKTGWPAKVGTNSGPETDLGATWSGACPDRSSSSKDSGFNDSRSTVSSSERMNYTYPDILLPEEAFERSSAEGSPLERLDRSVEMVSPIVEWRGLNDIAEPTLTNHTYAKLKRPEERDSSPGGAEQALETVPPECDDMDVAISVEVEDNLRSMSLREESRLISCSTRMYNQDSARAKAHGIDIPVYKLVTMSVEDFNEALTRVTIEQGELMRDIRRRGKNKVAAMNCRDRKMKRLDTMADVVKELERDNAKLSGGAVEIEEELEAMKKRYYKIYDEVFSMMRDEYGDPLSQEDFFLFHDETGTVSLTVKDSSELFLMDDGTKLEKPFV